MPRPLGHLGKSGQESQLHLGRNGLSSQEASFGLSNQANTFFQGLREGTRSTRMRRPGELDSDPAVWGQVVDHA